MKTVKKIVAKATFGAFALVFILLFSACSDKKEKIVGEPMPIVRLDRDYATYPTLSAAEQSSLFERDSTMFAAQMQVMGIDNAARDEMESFCSSDVVAMFAPAVAKVFPDMKTEEQALGNIVVRAGEQGIALPSRKYAAIVWGLPQSMVVNGDKMYIALNHYLGADHPAYEGWPEYQRRLKRRDMIPYDMAEALLAIERPYSPTDGNDNVLSRLLYEGALVHAKMQLIDNPSLANAIGVTQAQLDDMMPNRSFMWKRLITDDMLHSSDANVMDQLFSPAPATSIISPDAPGRAVRLIGYEIVDFWLKKNPEAKISDLLSPSFYSNPATLNQAEYKAGEGLSEDK